MDRNIYKGSEDKIKKINEITSNISNITITKKPYKSSIDNIVNELNNYHSSPQYLLNKANYEKSLAQLSEGFQESGISIDKSINLSDELKKMIEIQRNYQLNSKLFINFVKDINFNLYEREKHNERDSNDTLISRTFLVKTKHESQPLCLAIEKNDQKLAIELIKNHIYNEEHCLNDGITPIQYAAILDQYDVVVTIYEKKIDINAKSLDGKYFLHKYIEIRSHESPFKNSIPQFIKEQRIFDNDVSYLVHRTKISNQEIENRSIDFLIEKGLDINSKDQEGKTALIYSSVTTFADIDTQIGSIKYLLNKGVDANIVDNYNMTMFDHIVLKNNVKAFDFLLLPSNNVSAFFEEKIHQDFNKLIYHSTMSKIEYMEFMNNNIVDRLLEYDIYENVSAKAGCMPIHYAAITGNRPAINALLNCNVDIDLRDTENKTALMYAVQFGHLNVVKFLIEKGADVNASDIDGCSALYYALFVDSRIMEELIKHSADINIRSVLLKLTPLEAANLALYSNYHDSSTKEIIAKNKQILIEHDAEALNYDDAVTSLSSYSYLRKIGNYSSVNTKAFLGSLVWILSFLIEDRFPEFDPKIKKFVTAIFFSQVMSLPFDKFIDRIVEPANYNSQNLDQLEGVNSTIMAQEVLTRYRDTYYSLDGCWPGHKEIARVAHKYDENVKVPLCQLPNAEVTIDEWIKAGDASKFTFSLAGLISILGTSFYPHIFHVNDREGKIASASLMGTSFVIAATGIVYDLYNYIYPTDPEPEKLEPFKKTAPAKFQTNYELTYRICKDYYIENQKVHPEISAEELMWIAQNYGNFEKAKTKKPINEASLIEVNPKAEKMVKTLKNACNDAIDVLLDKCKEYYGEEKIDNKAKDIPEFCSPNFFNWWLAEAWNQEKFIWEFSDNFGEYYVVSKEQLQQTKMGENAQVQDEL